MLIKPLVLEDSCLLAALHRRCFAGEAWSQSQLEGSLSLPTTRAYGAWDGDDLTGFVLTQNVGDESEILTLAVDPSFQRRGIARALMQEVIKNRSCGSIFLEVAADNHAAMALYESCGFQFMGRRTGYYKREKTLVDALNYRYLVNG